MWENEPFEAVASPQGFADDALRVQILKEHHKTPWLSGILTLIRRTFCCEGTRGEVAGQLRVLPLNGGSTAR